MPFGIRPRPKPNPDAIRINTNEFNKNSNNNNNKQLGNAGNLDTLIKLYCELQTYGFCVVRRGHRDGLPVDKPSIWVFCPLLKKNFPRDRKLCEECKNCSHYKGVSKDLSLLNGEVKDNKSFIHVVKPKPKIKLEPKKIVKKEIEEKIEKEETDLAKANRKWKEEEEKLFGEK
jgi:hypothetical protein